MTNEILKFTRIVFAIHFIFNLIYTIVFWVPEISGPIFGLSVIEDTITLCHLIGAVYLGFAIGSLYGCLAKQWIQIKVLVYMNLIWLIMDLILVFINLSSFSDAIYGSIFLTILIAVLLFLVYLQQEEKIKQFF